MTVRLWWARRRRDRALREWLIICEVDPALAKSIIDPTYKPWGDVA